MKTAPNMYIGFSEGEVIEKLNVYQAMARKFIAKNRKYQPIWKIYCLEDNRFCLVFTLINKGHNAIKEQEAFYQESAQLYWNTYINSYVAV